MKTKNIFKTLALAMLMPTMLLTTACSSEDDVVNSNIANIETVANKGYALPVTVNVTREGDKGSNRASYNESTRKLAFGEGDKLFVGGNYDDWNKRFAGTLDYDAESGKFKGTIYTQDDTYKTYEDLFGNSDYTIATLLPAGYKDHGYLVINTNDPDAQYDDFVEESNEYILATSKANGVAQFSYEKSYNYNDGFALSPDNAILNFTITGLAASTSVNVSLTSMAYIITGTVTTDGSGNATFAAGISDGLNLQPFSLTVGGKNITLVSSDKVVAKGNIYNITRSALTYPIALSAVTSGYLGSVVTSDGYVYAKVADATAVSKTAVAKITYVGSETGVAGKTHGLALSLSNVSTANYYWATAISACASKTPAVTNASSWMLPSKDQWTKMIDAAGGYKALRNSFSGVGGTNLNSSTYWSSTDHTTEGLAWAHKFKDSNGGWAGFTKETTSEKYTRACIAF